MLGTLSELDQPSTKNNSISYYCARNNGAVLEDSTVAVCSTAAVRCASVDSAFGTAQLTIDLCSNTCYDLAIEHESISRGIGRSHSEGAW
jgi:hypothetical protein